MRGNEFVFQVGGKCFGETRLRCPAKAREELGQLFEEKRRKTENEVFRFSFFSFSVSLSSPLLHTKGNTPSKNKTIAKFFLFVFARVSFCKKFLFLSFFACFCREKKKKSTRNSEKREGRNLPFPS